MRDDPGSSRGLKLERQWTTFEVCKVLPGAPRSRSAITFAGSVVQSLRHTGIEKLLYPSLCGVSPINLSRCNVDADNPTLQRFLVSSVYLRASRRGDEIFRGSGSTSLEIVT